MLRDDGDIIRGLGLVTLYAAYLEEEIDALLGKLGPVEEFSEDKQRLNISNKIKHAKKVLRRTDKEKFEDLIKYLDECKGLFEHRNILVHGRIYGRNDRPDILKSGRQTFPIEKSIQWSYISWQLNSLWQHSIGQ